MSTPPTMAGAGKGGAAMGELDANPTGGLLRPSRQRFDRAGHTSVFRRFREEIVGIKRALVTVRCWSVRQ